MNFKEQKKQEMLELFDSFNITLLDDYTKATVKIGYKCNICNNIGFKTPSRMKYDGFACTCSNVFNPKSFKKNEQIYFNCGYKFKGFIKKDKITVAVLNCFECGELEYKYINNYGSCKKCEENKSKNYFKKY